MITPVRKPNPRASCDREEKPHDNLEARLRSLKLKRHFSKSRTSLMHLHDSTTRGSPVPTTTRGYSNSSLCSDRYHAYSMSQRTLNTETSFEVAPNVHCVSMVMESLTPRSVTVRRIVRFLWTCVVALMVTGWWRGVWLLMDSYPVTAHGVNWQNAIFSLLLGVGLIGLCFASRQALVQRFLEQDKALDGVVSTPATGRLSLLGKALDWLFSVVLAFAVVAQMRGAWHLCDLYVLPNNIEMSAWITLSIAIVILTLSASFKCVITDVFADNSSTGPFFSADPNRTLTPYPASEFDTSGYYDRDYPAKPGTYVRERVTPIKKITEDSVSSDGGSQCGAYSDSGASAGGDAESDPEMRGYLEARACARDGKLPAPVTTRGRDKRLSFAEFMGIKASAITGKPKESAASTPAKNRVFSLFPSSKTPITPANERVRQLRSASPAPANEVTPTRATGSTTLLRKGEGIEFSPDKLSEIELTTPQKDVDHIEGFHAGDTPGSAAAIKYHSRIHSSEA